MIERTVISYHMIIVTRVPDFVASRNLPPANLTCDGSLVVANNRSQRCTAAGQHNNAMNVIWHHYSEIKLDSIEMIGDRRPAIGRYLADRMKHHDTIRNITKQVRPLVCADRDEVRAAL